MPQLAAHGALRHSPRRARPGRGRGSMDGNARRFLPAADAHRLGIGEALVPPRPVSGGQPHRQLGGCGSLQPDDLADDDCGWVARSPAARRFDVLVCRYRPPAISTGAACLGRVRRQAAAAVAAGWSNWRASSTCRSCWSASLAGRAGRADVWPAFLRRSVVEAEVAATGAPGSRDHGSARRW